MENLPRFTEKSAPFENKFYLKGTWTTDRNSIDNLTPAAHRVKDLRLWDEPSLSRVDIS